MRTSKAITISISRELFEEAEKRRLSLEKPTPKFSQYIQRLLEKDIRERGNITFMIKEESSEYPNPTQVLKTRKDHLPKSADQTRPKGKRASSRKNRSPKAPPDKQE